MPRDDAHDEVLAGRRVPRVYRVSNRQDLHAFLIKAVEASGGNVLYASDASRVPVYLGVENASGERIGLMVYPFRVTRVETDGRPSDEVRGQLRYGGEASWETGEHWVARDIAGVDTTLLLGVYLDGPLLIGLDPALYDPLPLGISAAYMRDHQVDEVQAKGWVAWERNPHSGRRRPRRADGIETLVAFSPDRLLDYAALERGATSLGLDSPLRLVAANDAARASVLEQGLQTSLHSLEASFDLDAREILDIIHTRMRLEVAVKGGVAEHHLEKRLRTDPAVQLALRLDEDGKPDFDVQLHSGRRVLVECKNASGDLYANGDYKVEVQKTRATRDDPAGRLYRPDQFDVVAACLYSATRSWEFRYKRTDRLARHDRHPDRLAALHRVDATWATTLEAALEGGGHAEST
ncbi:MAG: hypothetical protein WCD35_01350 [Mycobacteriales bacterium]